jgi:hypothetical protein
MLDSEERRYQRKDRRTATSKPQLEHRHYAVIAYVIKNFIATDIREDVAQVFGRELKHTNPKFDRRRFLIACGVVRDD